MTDNEEDTRKSAGKDEPEGDFRTLGYGHRAYNPDPKARYTFNPGQPRTLPQDQGKRWRVTG